MQLGFPEFIRITIVLGFVALAIGLVVFIRDFGRMQGRLRRSFSYAPLDSTESRPHTLRVLESMPEGVLWHLTRLPGLQVVSAKTITGEPNRFESCFLYKERLFVMEEPPFCVTISLLGQPPDKALFAEIEIHVRRYNRLTSFPGAIATALRCLLLPRNPPRAVMDRYYPDNPAARRAEPWLVRSSKQGTDDARIDPLAEAEVYLAAGQKQMAIQILEQASREEPMPDEIRRRLSELQRGS
jgi:hypothetical protein